MGGTVRQWPNWESQSVLEGNVVDGATGGGDGDREGEISLGQISHILHYSKWR